MSHADEGTLHAYLDGELTAVEREGLEAHLTGCAACRTRLAEERELIERARGLLARTAPPLAVVPPRRRSEGGRGAQPLPRWLPLAWAASVLIALGGGWIARGGSAPGSAVGEPLLADRLESARSGNSAGRDDAPVEVALGERDATGPTGAPTTSVTLGRPAAEAKATAEEEREAGAGAAAGIAPVAADQASRLATPPPAPAAQAAAPRAEAVGQAAGFAARNADVAAVWVSVTVDSARAILGAAPVTIPGVPVRRIGLGGPGVVVVEQALGAGTVVQLYERRADAADEAQRPYRAAAQEVARQRQLGAAERLARYVGPLRVEIAGAVGIDSLSRLLERVR